MAIEVIDKIKQKNNGDFALMDASDVEMLDGTRLEDKVKEIEVVSKTSLPDNYIAKSGVMYFLGEIAELDVGFPDDAKNGDMIYICFSSGDEPTVLNISTENHIGIDGVMIKANRQYELIGLWTGTAWWFVKNEVT